MPYKSRWTIDVPVINLASLLLQSPTEPLSRTHKCYLDAARPETHYLPTHDFRLWSQRFAAGLLKSGLQPGDRVLLFSGNDLFFPVVFMSVVMAGGVFTGANPTFVARELAYQLKDSGATYLICTTESLDTGIEAAKQAHIPQDHVFAYDSSIYDGTTNLQSGYRYWSDLIASEEGGRAFVWDELPTPAQSVAHWP